MVRAIVYRIYDKQDKEYNEWFGDIDDIIRHIEELHISNGEMDYVYYDNLANKSWEQELSDFGLNFEEIYNKYLLEH